ncbi:MAG: hypothetical protein ACE5IR_09565 [bacterium]
MQANLKQLLGDNRFSAYPNACLNYRPVHEFTTQIYGIVYLLAQEVGIPFSEIVYGDVKFFEYLCHVPDLKLALS